MPFTQPILRSLLILLLSAVFHPLFSQNRTYTTSRIEGSPPVIDGLMDDPAWKTAEWSGDFTQKEPYENAKPSQETAFKVLYDDNNLYILIRAFDTEPEKIERRLGRRDNTDGDWVGVGIGSYNDKLTGFGFSVNASGVKWDGVISNDIEDDGTPDPVWYVKTTIDGEGWLAEMKIPYNQLRFADRENHVWGFEVMRYLFRMEEFSVWKMIPQSDNAWVSAWGELDGIQNIKPKKEIELIPYVMGKFETFEKEAANPFANTGKGWAYNAGLDGKVAITNDFTLNFTVNPDFGQVEADPSEVNLSAFESYFPEKRPFFVEGSNIFNYSLTAADGMFSQENLFYSRRIGRSPHYEPELSEGEYAELPENTAILGALKLSGKTRNGWSIGVMESLTNNEWAHIDSLGTKRREAVEPMTNYFNTRVQKDMNNGNTILGGMITATNRFSDHHNFKDLPTAAYTAGVDFAHYWKNKSYHLGFKTLVSTVQGSKEAILRLQEAPQRYFQRPESPMKVDSSLTVLNGHSGSLTGGKVGGGHWRYSASLTWKSPGLELNDQGYLRMTDFIQEQAYVGYRLWEPFSIFRSMNINLGQWLGGDFSGLRTFSGTDLNVNMQFKNYWRFATGVSRSFREIHRFEMRGGPAYWSPSNWDHWFEVSSDERKKLAVEWSASNTWGDQQYLRKFHTGLEFTYRPIQFIELLLEPAYSYSNRHIIYVETIDFANDHRYITARIKQEMLSADIRINVSITPELTIQYWGQPFVFSGDYSEFKKLDKPMDEVYAEQFHLFTEDELNYDAADNRYVVDEGGTPNTSYGFDNPDFSFFEFRSNLVIRWEYLPGSTAYLVWSQGRTGDHPEGRFSLSENIGRLADITPNNVFLLKLSYRLSL